MQLVTKTIQHRITLIIDETISFSKNFFETFTVREFNNSFALFFLVDLVRVEFNQKLLGWQNQKARQFCFCLSEQIIKLSSFFDQL